MELIVKEDQHKEFIKMRATEERTLKQIVDNSYMECNMDYDHFYFVPQLSRRPAEVPIFFSHSFSTEKFSTAPMISEGSRLLKDGRSPKRKNKVLRRATMFLKKNGGMQCVVAARVTHTTTDSEPFSTPCRRHSQRNARRKPSPTNSAHEESQHPSRSGNIFSEIFKIRDATPLDPQQHQYRTGAHNKQDQLDEPMYHQQQKLVHSFLSPAQKEFLNKKHHRSPVLKDQPVSNHSERGGKETLPIAKKINTNNKDLKGRPQDNSSWRSSYSLPPRKSSPMAFKVVGGIAAPIVLPPRRALFSSSLVQDAALHSLRLLGRPSSASSEVKRWV